MKVECKIAILEINGRKIESPSVTVGAISVSSHRTSGHRVNLEIDGKSLTVSINELRAAIDNAANTARFLI